MADEKTPNKEPVDYKILSDEEMALSDEELEITARTEHNRWNIERLLMGYRPATPEEAERATADPAYKKRLKDTEFVHINIAPYDAIPESTREIDRIMTRLLQRIEQ